MLNKLKENWFFYLIILQPILDIVAYFQKDNIVGSLAGYSRLIVMFIVPVLVLIMTKKKKNFILWMSAIAIFSLLHIVNSYRVGYISLYQDVAYLLRVIQMPILAVSFMYYIKSDHYIEMTSKSFVINAVVIFVTMSIAHLTGTADWSYEGYNIGLKGWFANSNSQSIIIITLVPFVLYYTLLKNKIWVTTALSLLACFLLISNGTKAAYYSIFLIFGGFAVFLILEYFMHKKNGEKLKLFSILCFVVLCVGSFFAYPLTPRYDMDTYYNNYVENDQAEMDDDLKKMNMSSGKVTLEEILADPIRKQELIDYYGPKLNEEMVERFGVETVLEAYGWWPDSQKLTDMRFKKVTYANLLWEESDSVTKFVGFEYSRIHGFDLENDYPAIYFYYGYIGMGLYIAFLLYFIYLVIVKCVKDFKGVFNSFNFTLLLTYALQLGLAQFSGAILRRPNVSIYMSIIMALIYYQCKKNSKDVVE